MGAIRASVAARPALAFGAAALFANMLGAGLATRSPTSVVVAVFVVAVVVLAFVRPGVLLCAATVGIVVSADLLGLVAHIPQFSLAGLQLQLSDLYLAAMLLAWAGWELRRERPAAVRLRSLAREPAFVAFVPLLGFGAFDLARGGYGTLSSSRIFLYCIAVPLVVRVVETPRHLRVLGLSLVVGGVATSLVAGAMVASGRNVTESGLSTGGIRGLSIGGSFLVAGALLYVLASAVSRPRVPGPVVAALALVLAAGVTASGARETWIGIFAALAVYVVVSPGRSILRLALVAGLAGLLAFGAYSLVPHPPRLEATLVAVEHRLAAVSPGTASQDPSVQVRYDKWNVVWGQLKARPWLGTGFGYPATYTSNIGGNNFVRSYVDDPENTQLWLWARMGTLGFAAWVSFNLLAAGTLVARIFRGGGESGRIAALWALGIMLVVWSGMTFSPVSAFGSTLLLYWVAVGLVPVARRF